MLPFLLYCHGPQFDPLPLPGIVVSYPDWLACMLHRHLWDRILKLLHSLLTLRQFPNILLPALELSSPGDLGVKRLLRLRGSPTLFSWQFFSLFCQFLLNQMPWRHDVNRKICINHTQSIWLQMEFSSNIFLKCQCALNNHLMFLIRKKSIVI